MKVLEKCPTGIRGLDEITGGGLPFGRPTLVVGGAGCGKTLLATSFLVFGALEYDEPGVFISFEETATELTENVASLGFDLAALIAGKRLLIDHVRLERKEIVQTGEYDLGGLFIRLDHAIDSIGAKRVVLDTLETLFAGLPDQSILRSELRRLLRWLKDKGVTAIITGERGEATLTRHGFEEYVSDCVVELDHRVSGQRSTRRLRVTKYRGSFHGTNEYPFLIDERGFSLLPVTSLGLDHPAANDRIPTGIARLDEMLGGQGFYRGSSILVSGTAGSGKTSVAAQFAVSVCQGGERCLVFLYEEGPSALLRNMRSVGLKLEPWVKKGLLRLVAARPSVHGLETHLAIMLKTIDEFQPSTVILDPISSFDDVGEVADIKSMLIQLVDHSKARGITLMLLDLTGTGGASETGADVAITSLIDTWLALRDIERNGERNRGVDILKSRGMSHSNQVREFLLTEHGVELVDVYVGPAGMLAGSARLTQEAREEAERLIGQQEVERQREELEYKREVLERRIDSLRAELAKEEVEARRLIRESEQREQQLNQDRQRIAHKRRADPDSAVERNTPKARKGGDR